VLADLGLHFAPPQSDAILPRNRDLIPPVLVALGIGGITAVGVVAQVVAKPLGHLRDVIRVSLPVVIGLAICVGIPFAQDVILGLDRFAYNPPASLVGFQVGLEPLDPAGELGGVLAREIAGLIDVMLVQALQVHLQPAVDLLAHRRLGMLSQKLPRPFDLIGE